MIGSRVGAGDVLPLVMAGYSDQQIADRLGVSRRTVARRRALLGVHPLWVPLTPAHGTPGRYARGCRCSECRSYYAAAHRSYYAAAQAATAAAGHYAEPWTPAADAVALDATRSLADRARALGRTYSATRNRIALLRRRGECLTR